jgi:hypothetical protein
MLRRPVYLTDASANRLAKLDVSPLSDRFEGSIDLKRLPDELLQLFTEFEGVVEGQVFSRLDPIEERIKSAQFRVTWDDGARTPVDDLQVFPSTGAVSLRATPPASVPVKGPVGADPTPSI